MYLCICVFVFERVVVGEWIVDIISFQKIFGLCYIVEIWRDVTFEDDGRTDDGNVNIVLESAKQDSQFAIYRVFQNEWQK